jgi:hypothetical protein
MNGNRFNPTIELRPEQVRALLDGQVKTRSSGQ